VLTERLLIAGYKVWFQSAVTY